MLFAWEGELVGELMIFFKMLLCKLTGKIDGFGAWNHLPFIQSIVHKFF